MLNKLLIEEKLRVNELCEAIKAGVIIAHYQPQVEIETGDVKSVEALARWPHPQRGMIPPDIFVDLAEREKAIDQLTEEMICQATEQGAAWRDQGHTFKVAVNLSMLNLQRIDFPERLVAMVDAMEFSDLTLEVKEKSLMGDLASYLGILTRLHRNGMALSIDDFGCGEAPLEQLKQMAFTELKLDRTYVHGARKDPEAYAILENSVSLARQIGMPIVAKGVEDQEDWDLVVGLGCDLVQGYFVAPPMPADVFDAWLKTR